MSATRIDPDGRLRRTGALLLLLAVAAVGLGTTLLAPMSFAAGASTLLLAIVIDACYGGGSASGAR